MEAPTDRALPSGPRPAPPGGEHADAAAAEGLGLPLGLPRGGGLPPHEPCGAGTPPPRGHQRRGVQRGGRRLLRQKGQPPPPPRLTAVGNAPDMSCVSSDAIGQARPLVD